MSVNLSNNNFNCWKVTVYVKPLNKKIFIGYYQNERLGNLAVKTLEESNTEYLRNLNISSKFCTITQRQLNIIGVKQGTDKEKNLDPREQQRLKDFDFLGAVLAPDENYAGEYVFRLRKIAKKSEPLPFDAGNRFGRGFTPPNRQVNYPALKGRVFSNLDKADSFIDVSDSKKEDVVAIEEIIQQDYDNDDITDYLINIPSSESDDENDSPPRKVAKPDKPSQKPVPSSLINNFSKGIAAAEETARQNCDNDAWEIQLSFNEDKLNTMDFSTESIDITLIILDKTTDICFKIKKIGAISFKEEKSADTISNELLILIFSAFEKDPNLLPK